MEALLEEAKKIAKDEGIPETKIVTVQRRQHRRRKLERASTDNRGYRHPDGTYDGELHPDSMLPDGFGTYHYRNGDIFVGNWKKSVRMGKGKMQYANGDKFEGDYHLDKAEGHGVYMYANGDTHTGNYENGQMHGYGSIKYHNGDLYEGRFRYGMKSDRNARFTYANGDVFTGKFRQNKPYGKGRLETTSYEYDEETGEVVNSMHSTHDIFNGKLIEIDPATRTCNVHDEEFNDDARSVGSQTTVISDDSDIITVSSAAGSNSESTVAGSHYSFITDTASVVTMQTRLSNYGPIGEHEIDNKSITTLGIGSIAGGGSVYTTASKVPLSVGGTSERSAGSRPSSKGSSRKMGSGEEVHFAGMV